MEMWRAVGDIAEDATFKLWKEGMGLDANVR